MINSFWQLYITATGHWLKVIIRRFSGVEQPCEGELEGGGVALHQLRGDVEVGVVPTITRAQRPRRHVEEIFARQPERVRGRGRDVRANLLKGDRGCNITLTSVTLAIHMYQLTCFKYTSRTLGPVVTNLTDHVEH